VEVTKGVRAGEKVAAAANFLIDSEAKLKESFSRQAGIMEYWNDGIMGKKLNLSDFVVLKTQYSNIPSFHYSKFLDGACCDCADH